MKRRQHTRPKGQQLQQKDLEKQQQLQQKEE